ncbi:hypothetical protein C0Q70_00577 [Pomacea canaliculata]|uniref:Uncharacterized protein n=2 Tax=Pomacea canaliculata TaxID=400727 RepID=A0A2T7PX25_POMCA|nr:hypothetical protein C0Q70_00577 [Pomacea canaliculata]
MKRDGDPESDRLLPDKAEASSKGQHAPNYSPSTHQATQTEADAHLPNPLTKFTSNANSNFLHLDRTFPMVSSVVTAPVAAPPILANGQRSGHRTPDRDPLERREPRHRLKAAPEDDNVTETRTPVGVTAPITTGGNSPEIVELTATGPDPTDQRRFLGPEHEKQGGWTPETFSSLIPFTEMSEPVRMEVRPTANVYAQMKPLPKAPNAPNTILHTPPSKDAPNTVKVVDVSFPETPPMNGVLIGDSDNEGESVTSPQLPLLHISEEDLTRNVHKPQKPFPGGGLSSPSAPPTVSLTPASPARALEPRPESFPSQFPVGVRAPPNSSSLSDEDSGGFSVRNLSGSEATSPTYFSSAATARPYHYAFDPTADSDPSELLDEFMHVPPNTYLAGGLDDRRELRLRDVRDNQEAIPI